MMLIGTASTPVGGMHAMSLRQGCASFALVALGLAGAALAQPPASRDATPVPLVAYAALPELWLKDGEVRGMELWMHFDLANGQVIEGDRASGATDCSADGWSCISVQGHFDFAIRRDWETPPRSWEYRGVNYRFVGDLDHAVLGRDVSGHVVCAESVTRGELDRTLNACFLYNRARGVVAITLYEDAIGGPKHAEYFVAGEAGLFAAP